LNLILAEIDIGDRNRTADERFKVLAAVLLRIKAPGM
jgi:hypothetical protein